MSEYYRNENPNESGVYDPIHGGGWGAGSGTGTGGDWGTTPDGGTGTGGDWGGAGNVPYLKKSKSGYLLKHDNYLLTGTLHCHIAPSLLFWFAGDAGWKHDHRACILSQISPSRDYQRDDLTDWVAKPIPRTILAYRIDWFTGEFTIQAKWQAGHYPHDSINSLRVAVFGVDLGELVFPLQSWRDIATVIIDEDYAITVNGINGSINGNAQYLTNIG